jgi:hypothetical protein
MSRDFTDLKPFLICSRIGRYFTISRLDAFNLCSAILKHPPNGKHVDLFLRFLLLGCILYWGAPGIPMKTLIRINNSILNLIKSLINIYLKNIKKYWPKTEFQSFPLISSIIKINNSISNFKFG